MIRISDHKPLILITGCAGLIGSRLASALGGTGRYRVVGLDVVQPQAPEYAFIKCDLTIESSVVRAMEQVREEHGDEIASIIHLAAYYDFSGEPSPMYRTLTVEGTRRLIDALQPFETVEQFIFASSLLAMKPVEDIEEKLTERSPTRGEWDYPQSKLEAERVLKARRGRIPIVIHRLAGVYDDHGHLLPINHHIRRIYEKKLESYLFPGDSRRGQAFVHLDDVISCFEKTIEKRGELGEWELFLIAEPDLMSHRELQDAIGELVHGRQWPTIRIPKAAAKAGAWVKDKLTHADEFIKPWMIDLADDHYPVAINRAWERLNWRPQHRLRETLPAIIEELKRDPSKWYEENKLPLPHEMMRPRAKAKERLTGE